jgi:CheY-like chemotaxis protein
MNETSPIQGAEQIVKSAWRDQAVWSETANALKRELSWWRNLAAVAGVAGAFLATLAVALPDLGENSRLIQASIALTGAIVLSIVPYVAKTKASRDQVREWVRARSASEALKETIYRYLVGAQPFLPGSQPLELLNRIREVKDTVRDLSIYTASIEPPDKKRPLRLTIDDYIEKRVNDQIDKFYRPKGRENAIAAKRLHNWEFRLGLLAVIMSAAAGTAATEFPELSAIGSWVAVVTTAGAAVTAHLAASRYDHQAMTYLGTADRLAGLRDEWLTNPKNRDQDIINKFVDDIEHAISTENEAWLAEWTREKAER